jgi:hypothetical protein
MITACRFIYCFTDATHLYSEDIGKNIQSSRKLLPVAHGPLLELHKKSRQAGPLLQYAQTHYSSEHLKQHLNTHILGKTDVTQV